MMTNEVSIRPEPESQKQASLAGVADNAAVEPDEIDQLATAFTLAEVKKICRVSLPTVTRWVLDGKLSSIKAGHKRLVPRAALNKFLRGDRPKTAAEPTSRTPAERKAAADAAVETCRALGI
jgi:excisionase family DNA binding protein